MKINLRNLLELLGMLAIVFCTLWFAMLASVFLLNSEFLLCGIFAFFTFCGCGSLVFLSVRDNRKKLFNSQKEIKGDRQQ